MAARWPPLLGLRGAERGIWDVFIGQILVLDLSSPFVDAALPGGERLHVAIPDVTRTDWAVNIRKYVVRAAHLDDLVALGSLTPAAARFLSASVVAGLNVLVSGPTQAGKTTRCE